MSYDTPRYRRLGADLEIQNMLFEYFTLIASQGILVLYIVESFKISVSSVIYDSLRNIAICIGIDFFFNVLSDLFKSITTTFQLVACGQSTRNDIFLANLIIVIAIASYFSPIILTVFQARVNWTGARYGTYTVRNCTLVESGT